MKSTVSNCKRAACLTLVALFAAAAGTASAACSGYRGMVVVNEYNFTQNWIELKVLDSTVTSGPSPFAGWKLALWKKQGGGMVRGQEENVASNYTNASKNTCGTGADQIYVRIPFSGSNMSNDVIAVLWDSSTGTRGEVIDIFRLGQSSLQSYPDSINAGYTQYDQCPNIETVLPNTQYDAPLVGSSANKDMARLPDGTGPWTISPGTGSNSEESQCTTNDSTLAITKTPSSAVVGVGSGNPFTWTIQVTNGGTSASLSNVTISDTLPANMFLASCPAGATCAGPAGAYTGFSKNVGALAPSNTASVTATAYVTAVGSYTNTATATATELAPGYTQATGTVSTPVSTNAANFNCLDSSIGALANYSGSLARLYTKLANTNFSLDVVALNSAGGLETNYVGAGGSQKTVTLELVDNTQGTACVVGACTTSCGQTVESRTIRFAAGNTTGRSNLDNGTGAAVALSLPAYRNLICRVTDSAQALTRCSSDAFAVRPQNFTLASTLNNTAQTGAPSAAAGSNFALSATASAGYDGTPVPDLTLPGQKIVTHEPSNTDYTDRLAGAFPAATKATGVSSGTFQYHQVGGFRVLADGVTDGDFTEAAAADRSGGDCVSGSTGNTLVGNKYGCTIGSLQSAIFGRFYPDHFTLASKSFTAACAAGGFTYMGRIAAAATAGQQFAAFAFTLEARSANESVTTKYSGTYPTLGTITLYAENAASGSNLFGRITPAVSPPPAWTDGAYTLPANSYSFSGPVAGGPPYTADATWGSFDSLYFGVGVSDPDLATPFVLPADPALNQQYFRPGLATCAQSGGTVCSVAKINTTATRIRLGRLRFNNAVGSELLELPVTLSAQYWKDLATGWIVNSDDACTALITSDPAIVGPTPASAEYGTAPASTVGNLLLNNPQAVGSSTFTAASSKPVLRNAGVPVVSPASLPLSSGRATVYMSAPGADKSGSATLTAFAPDWLKFNAANPTARLRFGAFRGNEKFIYMRENF